MPRTIKFRVYAPLGKKFLYSYKNRGLAFSASREDSTMEQCGCWDLEQCMDDGFIIQQFTGLLDKNGKEIYEGDIVEYYLDNTFRDEIKWYNFGFILSSIESDGSMPLCQSLEYEIVGNIFENPELCAK